MAKMFKIECGNSSAFLNIHVVGHHSWNYLIHLGSRATLQLAGEIF